MATTLTCAIFGAVSGSSVAATASIGRITVPEMVDRYKYDVSIATGTVAASGTLAMIIPPSIVLVVLAPLLEVSVGGLLIAGVVPGILSAFIYMAMIWTRGRINPSLMPRPTTKITWHEKAAAIPGLWGVVAIFCAVVLGIYFGVFTPTEAAAVGAVVALVMLVRAKGKREWLQTARESFFETARTTSMLFFIFVGAMLLLKLLALSGATVAYARFVGGLPLPPPLIMFGVLLVCIPLGMVMSGLGTVLIAAPLVAPIAYQFGYDGIWLGIMLVKFAELGSITPPVCMSVYALKGVLGPGYALTDIMRGTVWFMAMDILTIGILFSFPQITLWIPQLMMAR
jgi:tripartite ATP-independent transporter DctM subunit